MDRHFGQSDAEQLKGSLRRQWGRLTDAQIEQIAGDRSRLASQIHKTYGIGIEEAEEQVERWEGCSSKGLLN